MCVYVCVCVCVCVCKYACSTHHHTELLRFSHCFILCLEFSELTHLCGLRHVLDQLFDNLRSQLILVHLDNPPFNLLVRNLDRSQQNSYKRQRGVVKVTCWLMTSQKKKKKTFIVINWRCNKVGVLDHDVCFDETDIGTYWVKRDLTVTLNRTIGLEPILIPSKHKFWCYVQIKLR